MANKMSEETLAIIERLKDEGKLSRNSGTNSIRSVKIQLGRFENVFKSISSNIAEQTSLMRLQAGLSQKAFKQQQNQAQFDELARDAAAPDVEVEESKGRDDKNINAFGDAISKAFTMQSLKNIALAGAGLFVGYNMLKGFINEETEGGFSRMEDTLKRTDWNGLVTSTAGMITSAGAMVTSLATIDWETLSTMVNKMIDGIATFEGWLGNLPGLILGGAIVRNAAAGLISGALSTRGDTGAGPRRGLSGLGGIRGLILGAVTSLAWMYGDKVKEWLIEDQGVDPDFATIGVDAVTAGVTGASLALMFGLGPTGILIGAAVGVAYVLGKGLYNWFQRQKALAADAAEKQMADMTPDIAADVATSGPTGGVDLTAIPGSGATDGETVVDLLGQRIAEGGLDTVLAAYRGNVNAATMNGISEYIERQLETLDDDDASVDAKNTAKINLQNLRNAFPELQTLTDNSGEGEFIRNFKDNIIDYFEDEGKHYGFRKGTGGFRNFGDGTLAMLHGNEAVVPRNSPEGQFLSMFQSVVKRRSGLVGSGDGGGTVVINAPTNVSPTVNNIQGAKTQNSMTILQGMGGGGGGEGFGGAVGLPYFAQ